MENALTPSEQIELFLDGELGQVDRDRLFISLEANPALRAEFDEALRLRSALASDARQLAPRSALTAALFSSIAGIEQHAGAVDSARPVSAASGSDATRSAALDRTTVGAIGIALLAVAAVFFISDRTIITLPGNSVGIGTRASAGPAAPIPGGDVPSGAGFGASAARRAERTVAADRSSDVDRESLAMATMPTIASVSIPIFRRSDFIPTFAEPESNSLTADPMPDPLPDAGPAHRFAVRAVAARSLSRVSGGAREDAGHDLLHNATGSIVYRLNESHAIGATFGGAMFPGITAMAREGRLIHPAVSWGGVTYEWTPAALAIASGLRPFADALIGASSAGPIARGVLGIAWEPLARASMSLGIEYIGLAYKSNSVLQGTGKFSISYGVSFQL